MRTLAFGDPESGIWGLTWGEMVLVGSLAGDATGVAAEHALDGLEVAAMGPEQPIDGGHAQLCRVTGSLPLDGVRRELHCLGVRGVQPRPHDRDSLRLAWAWFEPTLGFALGATRPGGARHHGDDLVAAAVFEEGGSVPVADPRLSTTYTRDGALLRIGLELWIGESEEEQFPRRVAGELAGRPVSAAPGDLTISVAPLRCHSRGLEGMGLYVLARP